MKLYNLPKGDGHKAVSVTSDDILLGSYAGLIGIKTGFTDAAGHTLLFEAVRNGRTLIGAVLGSPASSPFTGATDAAKVAHLGLRPPTVRLTAVVAGGTQFTAPIPHVATGWSSRREVGGLRAEVARCSLR